jgi:hypothetical protein
MKFGTNVRRRVLARKALRRNCLSQRTQRGRKAFVASFVDKEMVGLMG